MNTSKGAQEVAESCPETFLGIAVDFAEAITIIIAGILVPGMANGGMVSTSINNVVICRAFISVEGGGGSGVVFYLGLNCGLLSVVTDREANLTSGAPYHAQEWAGDRCPWCQSRDAYWRAGGADRLDHHVFHPFHPHSGTFHLPRSRHLATGQSACAPSQVAEFDAGVPAACCIHVRLLGQLQSGSALHKAPHDQNDGGAAIAGAFPHTVS